MKGNSQNFYTREALQEALIQLLEYESLEKISVTELTKRAGVSRMAYYRNYESMQDLFQDILDQFFKQFLHDSQVYILNNNWLGFWTLLFNLIYENRTYVQILLGLHQRALVLNYLNKAFTQNIKDLRVNYLVLGMIGMSFNIMIEWIENDFDLKPKELAELTTQFIHSDFSNDTYQHIPKKYL